MSNDDEIPLQDNETAFAYQPGNERKENSVASKSLALLSSQ